MKTTLISTLILLMACDRSEKGININNSAPEVVITSHQDGDVVYTDIPTEFTATVTDSNDGFEDLEVQWTMGERVACSFAPPDVNGLTTCNTSLAEGEGEIQVEVRDPQNSTGLAEVTLDLQLSNAPTAEILSPTADGVYYSDEIIEFAATVSDVEDAPEELTISWESSLMGVLSAETMPDSSGNISDFINLSPGEHGITLSVEDTSGKSTSQTVTIMVSGTNATPVCEIQSPASGSFGLEGEMVIFEGIANDADSDSNLLTVEWSSNIDGGLGSSTPNSSGEVTFPYSDLSNNTHVISMTVTDDRGAQCVADTIYSVGSPPSITLTSPSPGDIYTQNDNITFSATVTDNEDQPTELSVEWNSSIDGVFSTTGPNSSDIAQFSSNQLSTGSHSITVTVTDSDGLYSDVLVDIVVNGVPTQPTVSLTPIPAYTTDDLVATASGSTDPDGQPVTYTYEWFLNGNNSGITGSILPNSNTAKGNIWMVRATPTDGITTGPYTEESVTISNSAPTLSGVSISPSAPTTQDTLSCTFTESDADGDPVSTTIEWFINNNLQSSSSSTLAGPFQQGQTVTCRVTPTDGTTSGIASEATVTITNAPPSIASITYSPSAVTTDDILTATVSASDSDGDPITYTFYWSVDDGTGAQLVQTTSTGSFESDSLDGVTHFDRGDTITVEVVANDGNGTATLTSTPLVVGNAPPSAFNVLISPSDPVAGLDDLLCTAQTSDADMDAVVLSYEWTVNGVPSTITADTVPGSQTVNNEVWECAVTPNDGTDDGATASATVTVGANNEGAEGAAFCASAGLTTDSSGNQNTFCLSDEGISGGPVQDSTGNTAQPGSIYIFSPE
ncbi:MAG: Ig-like domain-containing protein [Myxococcota bacterium]|nr:Ig-like domain-containing protein [Myxococcota bacterium]